MLAVRFRKLYRMTTLNRVASGLFIGQVLGLSATLFFTKKQHLVDTYYTYYTWYGTYTTMRDG